MPALRFISLPASASGSFIPGAMCSTAGVKIDEDSSAVFIVDGLWPATVSAVLPAVGSSTIAVVPLVG